MCKHYLSERKKQHNFDVCRSDYKPTELVCNTDTLLQMNNLRLRSLDIKIRLN